MKRNSSFELLRIFCIFGIIYMHLFGTINNDLTTINQGVSLFINSLFNIGVTCFILISGYFGIKFDLKKLIRLDMMIVFFSLLFFFLGNQFSIRGFIYSALPVLSGKYWFISCYFWLTALSPILNLIPEHMGRKQFQKILILLLFLFSFIPTFLYFEIMHDSGKGLVHMIMIYLIGRYIKLYCKDFYPEKKLLLLFTSSLWITFILNMFVSLLAGKMAGIFSRDCSLFIIISAVLLFLYVRQKSFENKFINIISSNILAVYILESSVRGYVSPYIPLQNYTDKWYLFAIVAVYGVIIMFLCVLINIIRKYTIGLLEPVILKYIIKAIDGTKNIPFIKNLVSNIL